MAWREQATLRDVHVERILAIDFSVGVEGTNAITTAISVTSAVTNSSMEKTISLPFYISSDAAGQVLETSANCVVTAGTDGMVIKSGEDSDFSGRIVTETTGEMDFIITNTVGADVYYINIVMPDGRVETSSILDFAA